MYGLPTDFDPSVFVGLCLVQVSFSENTVHFVLGETASVTVESAVRYRVERLAPPKTASVPIHCTDLMKLLGRTILSASCMSDGTLRLDFEDGSSLEFLEDSKQYEAYHVRAGGRTIIV